MGTLGPHIDRLVDETFQAQWSSSTSRKEEDLPIDAGGNDASAENISIELLGKWIIPRIIHRVLQKDEFRQQQISQQQPQSQSQFSLKCSVASQTDASSGAMVNIAHVMASLSGASASPDALHAISNLPELLQLSAAAARPGSPAGGSPTDKDQKKERKREKALKMIVGVVSTLQAVQEGRGASEGWKGDLLRGASNAVKDYTTRSNKVNWDAEDPAVLKAMHLDEAEIAALAREVEEARGQDQVVVLRGDGRLAGAQTPVKHFSVVPKPNSVPRVIPTNLGGWFETQDQFVNGLLNGAVMDAGALEEALAKGNVVGLSLSAVRQILSVAHAWLRCARHIEGFSPHAGVVVSGYLHKETSGGKYARRWVVLESGKIHYYKSQPNLNASRPEKPLGVLELGPLKLISETGLGFSLDGPTLKKKYRFQAYTVDQKIYWFSCLSACCSNWVSHGGMVDVPVKMDASLTQLQPTTTTTTKRTSRSAETTSQLRVRLWNVVKQHMNGVIILIERSHFAATPQGKALLAELRVLGQVEEINAPLRWRGASAGVAETAMELLLHVAGRCATLCDFVTFDSNIKKISV